MRFFFSRKDSKPEEALCINTVKLLIDSHGYIIYRLQYASKGSWLTAGTICLSTVQNRHCVPICAFLCEMDYSRKNRVLEFPVSECHDVGSMLGQHDSIYAGRQM